MIDDTGRDDRGREHGLARQPALQPQQRDDADRGADAERRHQQTERRRYRRAAPASRPSGPSGTIAPPPINPPASPIITPRTSGFARMKPSPSLMSRQVCAAGTRSARAALGLVEPQPRDQQRRQQERAAVDPDRERLLLARRARSSAWKPPSQCAMPASAANITAPSGNVPNAATRPSELADASCSGSFTMLGTRRVLGRPPQQREHLDRERQDHEAPDVLPERQQREQPGPADVAA